MDNYECLAYASIALYNLQKEDKEVTVQNLRAEMTYLMDMNSGTEIERKYDKLK